ncbi:MAG: hypothetical protein WDN69_32385 [Aliidongia sp.]
MMPITVALGQVAAELDQFDHFAGLAAGREGDDDVMRVDQSQIAVRCSAGWMNTAGVPVEHKVAAHFWAT